MNWYAVKEKQTNKDQAGSCKIYQAAPDGSYGEYLARDVYFCNQIHVAVPVSIQNRSGGWAYDILYFHAESSAPPIEPEAQVPAATPTAEESEAETAPAATSSPAAAPTNLSPVSGSEDMQEVGSNPLWIGIVPVVVLIVVVFVFQQSRRKQ